MYITRLTIFSNRQHGLLVIVQPTGLASSSMMRICSSAYSHVCDRCRNRRNRNRNLKTSKALLKSQAHQGTSLFTSAATNQRGVPKGGSREAQVRIPEYQEGTE